MNKELVFVLEPDVGRVTVETSQASTHAVNELANDLGVRVNLNCARPAESKKHLPVLQPHPTSSEQPGSNEFSIWLYMLYHNSVVDGPGRRSVIQTAGCSIRCQGCFVPQTHERENGMLTPIHAIVDEIIAKRDVHDGVTILGGEPFDQPSPVAELVSRLKRHGLHITIYSGYTLEELIGRKDPNIDFVLTHIDLLIDGPFLRQLGQGAGEYRGSQNQKLINLTVK
ncbi:MAG: 4Fe-4S cluster-binding domain-containing protein [Pyrinomonadaceae bacterium]